MNAEQQTNFVLDCMRRLYDSGVTVRAVTCDGTEVSAKMFRKLGITMDDLSFPHPSCCFVYVYGIFDVCHMLKLVRNTFSDLQLLVDDENKEVRWFYIKKLLDVQEESGIRAANKLTVNHIQFNKHKMKVKLAAQVFSNSVADALDFLRDDMNDVDQTGNEATVRFFRVIDQLFDFLNCHSPFGSGPKGPLRKENMNYWTSILASFREYLQGMKTDDGLSMLEHRRKTALCGLIVDINSVLALATEVLTRENRVQFKFFLHINLVRIIWNFFSKIRSRSGFNNNPSVKQFQAAFKSLILKNCVAPSLNGNCKPLENDDGYIAIGRRSRASNDMSTDSADEVVVEMYVNAVAQSDFSSNCLCYICGFVAQTLAKSLSCDDCNAALFDCILDSPKTSVCSLTKRKDRGGLIHSSHSVYKIVSVTETVIRNEIIRTKNA